MADVGGNTPHRAARKCLAIFLGLVLLAVVLFSVPYVTTASNHVCTSRHCPICACILQFSSHLRLFGNGEPVQAICFIVLAFGLLVQVTYSRKIACKNLFLWKVRLNN